MHRRGIGGPRVRSIVPALPCAPGQPRTPLGQIGSSPHYVAFPIGIQMRRLLCSLPNAIRWQRFGRVSPSEAKVTFAGVNRKRVHDARTLITMTADDV